jgi:hypothetical protein
MAHIDMAVQAQKFIFILCVIKMGLLPFFCERQGEKIFMALQTRPLGSEMLRHLNGAPGFPVEISTVLHQKTINIFGS